MRTRDEMVRDLVEYELRYLLDNPRDISAVITFFVNGGFSHWSDDAVWEAYTRMNER